MLGVSMLKILFVQPYYQAVYHAHHLWIHEPLALEYVAAGIQNSHRAAMLDMRFDSDLEGCLNREKPDVVATTGYTMDFPAVLDILARTKVWCPETVTVVGGYHQISITTRQCPQWRCRWINQLPHHSGSGTFRRTLLALKDQDWKGPIRSQTSNQKTGQQTLAITVSIDIPE